MSLRSYGKLLECITTCCLKFYLLLARIINFFKSRHFYKQNMVGKESSVMIFLRG